MEKTQIKPEDPPHINELKNQEEVRIYRLHMLEENQIRILNKIDCLADKIELKCNDEIEKIDRRVELLEIRANKQDTFIDRLRWIIIAEGAALAVVIIQKIIGL